jgi:UDP-N-acetylmuramate dehydrogenase
VGAGMMINDLISEMARLGLTGLEFMVGIPGTIGGSVRGNAGAWQKTISELVDGVKVLDQDGQVAWLDKRDCRFDYRQSRFKKNQEIILEVKLKLKKGDRKKMVKLLREYREKRAEQPQEPSAGCAFVNPKPQAAGALIEKCGLKGKRVGDAQISPQHANFIINLGGAKAKDIYTLIQSAKKAVKQKFGVELKEEIQLVGFDQLG